MGHHLVGIDDAEGPPVPIPNTEVKLSGAENTWLATARENREMPTPTIHAVTVFAKCVSWGFPFVTAYVGENVTCIAFLRYIFKKIQYNILCHNFKIYSSIAQSVEHAAVNRRVVGSSPTWGARNAPRH